MQIVSKRDSLHENAKANSMRKKNVSAESFFLRVLSIN